MSINRALISQNKRHMMNSAMQFIMDAEACKGCQGRLFPFPVALEPPYAPITSIEELLTGRIQMEIAPEPFHHCEDLVTLRMWIDDEQRPDFRRAEVFLKSLSRIKHRVLFEITGNRDDITLSLRCSIEDEPVITAAYHGCFDLSRLSCNEESTLARLLAEAPRPGIVIRDYYPPPPYHHLLTQRDELPLSPLEILMSTLSEIPPTQTGFMQVVFQPVSSWHDWHTNTQMLTNLEYSSNLQSGIHPAQRLPQQTPSHEIHEMTRDLNSKAHNDKPFLSTSLRIGVISTNEDSPNVIKSLSAAIAIFQHGGRPLNFLTEEDYLSVLDENQICEMLSKGLNYRPGFLLNSSELSGLVHLPPTRPFEFRRLPLQFFHPVNLEGDIFSTGTRIGTCEYAGKTVQIYIPFDVRPGSTHTIGKTGTGKSEFYKAMAIEDISNGDGLAVLDPHGDMVESLLCQIPEEHCHRVIYVNPGLSDHVFIWNPLSTFPGQDVGDTASELVSGIHSVMSGWGDRLETLLRQTFIGLLRLQRGTLLDALEVLRKGSKRSEMLVDRILELADAPAEKGFWRDDFPNYRSDELCPPKNKLSKLLLAGAPSLMLSQPESRLDFRQIMDEGKILLVNLSQVATDVGNLLGSFMLSLLYLAAIGRSNMEDSERKTFHIFADEGYRFVHGNFEKIIAETRKFKVSLNLAHQYLGQFREAKADALASVLTTIIFCVNQDDANRLGRELKSHKVKPEDLTTLKTGEAYAKIGPEVVKIRTPTPKVITEEGRERAKLIIADSLRRYYKPTSVIKEEIRQRDRRWEVHFQGSGFFETCISKLKGQGNRRYDEFDE